jgi:hypothetical protein
VGVNAFSVSLANLRTSLVDEEDDMLVRLKDIKNHVQIKFISFSLLFWKSNSVTLFDC